MLGRPFFLPVHIDDRVVSCPSLPPRKEKKRNERSNTHRHVPFSTRKTPLTGDTANQKYEMFPVLCCRTHHHLFVCAKRILYAGILNPKLLQRFAHYSDVTLVRKSVGLIICTLLVGCLLALPVIVCFIVGSHGQPSNIRWHYRWLCRLMSSKRMLEEVLELQFLLNFDWTAS